MNYRSGAPIGNGHIEKQECGAATRQLRSVDSSSSDAIANGIMARRKKNPLRGYY
ncbi:hypothetical protein [Schlesneria paludicola]|uniref:hypothetical protein n=1 Tax=Schlesneria paludicola TaxID=360056 RepID=UPI0002D4B7B4|nr:hypothetical protein [Schlesneria paludicola]